jgi:hypothetical protein
MKKYIKWREEHRSFMKYIPNGNFTSILSEELPAESILDDGILKYRSCYCYRYALEYKGIKIPHLGFSYDYIGERITPEMPNVRIINSNFDIINKCNLLKDSRPILPPSIMKIVFDYKLMNPEYIMTFSDGTSMEIDNVYDMCQIYDYIISFYIVDYYEWELKHLHTHKF